MPCDDAALRAATTDLVATYVRLAHALLAANPPDEHMDRHIRLLNLIEELRNLGAELAEVTFDTL